MAINITDSGSDLKIDFTTAYSYQGIGTLFLPKSTTRVKAENTKVMISDSGLPILTIPAADITSPSGTAAVIAAAVAAFSANLGQVGGMTVKPVITPTVSSGVAYSIGDNVGGIMTITNLMRKTGGSGVVLDVCMWDKDKQNIPGVIDFWSASPSGTYTDNAAEVIAGDHAVWLGSLVINQADYLVTGAVSRLTKQIALSLIANASANIFATFVATGTGALTATYTSTSALLFYFGNSQD